VKAGFVAGGFEKFGLTSLVDDKVGIAVVEAATRSLLVEAGSPAGGSRTATAIIIGNAS
jgi:hypothetical protein